GIRDDLVTGVQTCALPISTNHSLADIIRNKMNSHKLFRLTQKLYGIPHLVNRQSFESITSYLNSRNANLMILPSSDMDVVEDEPDDLDDISDIGVIEIIGPLTNRPTGWEAMCGGCSYESIIEQADFYID